MTWLSYPSWLNAGDNAWQMTSATFVGLMSLPGLAILYGGVMQKRWSVNSMMLTFVAFCLVLVAWCLWAFKMGFDNPIAHAGAALDAARTARTGYTSTQEDGWMVIAAEALAAHKALSQFAIDGQSADGAIYRKWSGFALGQKLATIANTGKATAQLVTTSSGVPVTHDPAASEGYSVERTFYKLDGTKIDLKSLAQNERVVVVVKITESEARSAKLLVVDRLPAGLEIDNPTLFDSGSIDAFAWLKRDIDPVHTEYRDDRFVAAFDREPGQSAFFSIAYVARAVAPGLYVYPPATAEDMYRPDRFGRTAFGALEVTAK